jgi:hypothetical protein
MKKSNRIALKKMISEKFEYNKVYSDPRATAFKSEQKKINEEQSIIVDPYTSVRLLDDNSIGIFDKDRMVLRFTNVRPIDKMMMALAKLKKKM